MTSPERTLVGALILFPEAMPDALNLVGQDDFEEAMPKAVLAAMLLEEAAMRSWGIPSLHAILAHDDPPEGETWDAILVGLASEACNPALVVHHATLVRDASVKRKFRRLLVEKGPEMQDAKCGTGAVEDVLHAADTSLLEMLGASVSSVEEGSAASFSAQLQDAILRGQKADGVMCGLTDLDEVVLGMRPGELIVVGARPGVGKTALGMQIALNVARDKGSALFVSLEVGAQELAERLISNVAGIDSMKMRRRSLSRDEQYDMSEAVKELHSLNLHLISDAATTLSRLRGMLRKRLRKGPLSLVVIDYLQLMSAPGERDRIREVSVLSAGLKQTAKELRVPIIALSQLSRAAEGVKPTLAHLRESGTIEQDADVVLLLSTTEQKAMNVDVAKNRHGRTGDVPLSFVRPFFRISLQAPSSYGEAIYS